MGLIFALLPQLFAAYTVLAEPFLRTNLYRNLKKQLNVDPSARILYYRTIILWEWSWVVVLALIFIPIPDQFILLGVTLPSTVGWIIMGALVLGIGLSTYLVRRNPGSMASMQRSLQSSSVLLPSTQTERKWFTATAITAGICEELLYRGFLIYYLRTYFLMITNQFIVICIISGFIYGLSRAYLGRRGILLAMMNGFSYAVVYYLSGNLLSAIGSSQPVAILGSLLPAMVFHTLAELRTLWLWHPEEKKKKKSK
jgi:membrane protease YdiL (CAAX protease family)